MTHVLNETLHPRQNRNGWAGIPTAYVLDETDGHLTRLQAPTQRLLRDAVEEMLRHDWRSAVFLDERGRRGEEWGEISVPLVGPVDQEIWVE